MEYGLHILIMIGIYVILAVSYNILIGFVGIFAICQAAFYGIGAYISTLIMLHLGWNFIPAMFLGMLGAGIISLCVGIPALRIHWDYMAIFSFAFQMMIYHLLMNLVGITRGPRGIAGIHKPELFGFTFSSRFSFLILTMIFVVLVLVICRQIDRSPVGRIFRGIRADEIAVKSLGKNTTLYKVLAFVICGSLAAISGSLIAHHISYLSPFQFTLSESFVILCMVALGGIGNIWGALVGAVILISIPELLRFLPIPSTMIGGIRQLIYGLVLVLMMMFRQQGIIPERVGERQKR
ncbi:MAG: branched-chain amino acid ABC transporter permease [Pseudomonadota bacterium]